MTVASEDNRSGPYNGNGVTKVFDYDFKIVDESHLNVIKTSVAGVETTLTLGLHYSVSGVGNASGGSITAVSAPTSGERITILLNVPFTQETDLENQGAYYAETVEAAFDQAAQRDLQLKEEIGRAVKLPASLSDPDGTVKETLASGILRLADSADNIDAVVGMQGNLDTVAGNIEDVALVGSNMAAVLEVVGTAEQVRIDRILTQEAAEDATEIVTGLVMADQTEAEAGTTAGKITSPLRVRQHLEGGASTSPVTGGVAVPYRLKFGHHALLTLADFVVGAGEDGDEDLDTLAWQKFAASGELQISPRRGVSLIAETVELPVAVSIRGESGFRSGGVEFQSVAGGAYTQDFLFFLNIDRDNPETWVVNNPSADAGTVEKVRVNGTATNGINGFKFAGAYTFENIDCWKVGTLIRKPNLYTDEVTIRKIFAAFRANDTDYLIDLPGLGDGYLIKQISSGYINNQDGNTRGVYIGPSRGNEIITLINGHHKFQFGAYDVSDLHIEGGSVEFEDCTFHLHDSPALFTEQDADTAPVVRLLSSGDSFGSRYYGKISDCVFDAGINIRSGWPDALKGDIRVDPAWTVELEGNSRKIFESGDVTSNLAHMGIVVEKADGSLLDAFNDHSHVLSPRKTIISNQTVLVSGEAAGLTENFAGLSNPRKQDAGSRHWGAAAGTYYYVADILLDADRRIGRQGSAAELSITMADGDDPVTFDINWSLVTLQTGKILRLWRGTAAGLYTHYVDIPVISLAVVRDDGICVNNFPWISIGSAVARNTYNSGRDAEWKNGLIIMKTNAGVPPNLGTWKAGDRVMRETLSVPATGFPDDASVTITEFRRLTTGSGHVNGVDWLVLGQPRVS